MIVYLLSSGDYSDYTILGIYSSRAKAEREKALYEEPRKVPWSDVLVAEEANDIDEIELDARIPCHFLGDHPWARKTND